MFRWYITYSFSLKVLIYGFSLYFILEVNSITSFVVILQEPEVSSSAVNSESYLLRDKFLKPKKNDQHKPDFYLISSIRKLVFGFFCTTNRFTPCLVDTNV